MYELDDLNMDEAVLKQYSGEEEKITISEKIDNKKIVSVGAFAFSEHREIVEITLPGDSRFDWCTCILQLQESCINNTL